MIASPVGLANAAGVVISLSALFSTGSAINATLFSAGYFAKGMLENDLLPDRTGDASAGGVPTRTVLLLGTVTAAFTTYGSLSAITSFASLSFIVVFGGVSALAVSRRDDDRITATWPVVGVIGGVLSFVLMFYHLFTTERGTFYAVVLIAVAVFSVELLTSNETSSRRRSPSSVTMPNESASGRDGRFSCFRSVTSLSCRRHRPRILLTRGSVSPHS